MSICRQAMLEEMKDPAFITRHELVGEDANLGQEIIESDLFISEVTKEYHTRV